jgi:hypothetical protein
LCKPAHPLMFLIFYPSGSTPGASTTEMRGAHRHVDRGVPEQLLRDSGSLPSLRGPVERLEPAAADLLSDVTTLAAAPPIGTVLRRPAEPARTV